LGYYNQYLNHNIAVLNCLKKLNKIIKKLRRKTIGYLKELKFLMNL